MSQLSLLPDLDRASDTREQNLCKGWVDATENDFGVLVNEVREFEAKPKNRYAPCVRITCGLVYPKCYYEVDVHDMTGCCASPLMQDYSPNFDVHEHTANVMLMVESEVRRRCRGYKIPDKLIETALGMMREEINKEVA